jgi:hypothetical protein
MAAPLAHPEWPQVSPSCSLYAARHLGLGQTMDAAFRVDDRSSVLNRPLTEAPLDEPMLVPRVRVPVSVLGSASLVFATPMPLGPQG